jgi:hypothetical protein
MPCVAQGALAKPPLAAPRPWTHARHATHDVQDEQGPECLVDTVAGHLQFRWLGEGGHSSVEGRT